MRRLDRSGQYGTGRSHCSSYRKDRPVITNNIKPLGSSWDRSGEMVMNKVGDQQFFIFHIYNRHSIHYSVVSCPLGLHAVGEKYIYALPFPTQSTPLHLHVQMVLEGNPGRERGSPVDCSFVPVGLVLTFEETDRFSDRTGRFWGGGW